MNLNIFHFVAGQYATRLKEAGYAAPDDDEAAILAYENVRRRSVAKAPRKVRKVVGYTVPADLFAGEKAFAADVVVGADLRPYQSTGLDQANRSDGMLYDFGIQHFHTSVEPHPTRPRYRQRTDPLLFAVVTPTDLYCLGFFKHGSWSEQALLDLVYENWPELLERYAVKDAIALRHSYTSDDLARLRKAQINTPTQRPDGTIHFSPGGGVTTSGTSLLASMRLIDLGNVCESLERQVRVTISEMVTNGEIQKPEELKIEKLAGYVCVRGSDINIRLGSDLLPSPL